jgi:tRNA (cytidine/uridine-2'-O-)-methyltransferase
MFNIVLLEPEIPQNTANIGRSCVCTGSRLHLIRPLGFFIDERAVRRAGLDYWDKLDLSLYDGYGDFMAKNNYPEIFMATTKARKTYDSVSYAPGAYIMFGKESAGIPEELLLKCPDMAVRIPMLDEFRSLNLSNSVAVILYEALRQNSFGSLKNEGQLHHNKW